MSLRKIINQIKPHNKEQNENSYSGDIKLSDNYKKLVFNLEPESPDMDKKLEITPTTTSSETNSLSYFTARDSLPGHTASGALSHTDMDIQNSVEYLNKVYEDSKLQLEASNDRLEQLRKELVEEQVNNNDCQKKLTALSSAKVKLQSLIPEEPKTVKKTKPVAKKTPAKKKITSSKS